MPSPEQTGMARHEGQTATLSRPARRSPWTFTGLLEVATMFVCGAVVASCLSRVWWIFELATHFRPHLAILLASLSAWWLMRKNWKLALACALLALIGFVPVYYALKTPPAREVAGQGRVRIVSINVHTANQRSDLVLDFIHESTADIVLLMEVNARWMRDLESVRENYPHMIADPREDNFGIALFSRVPLTNAGVLMIGEGEVPSVAARFAMESESVWIFGTHPLPPVTGEYAKLRNDQLREVASWVSSHSDSVILVGDLNATPWSPHFRDLLRRSGMKHGSISQGLKGTWPATWVIGRIPLDHCLVSSSFEVFHCDYGPRIGGDHLPLIVEVALNPGEAALAAPHH